MKRKAPSPQGGDGGTPDWSAKRETREHLRLLEDMVYGGWEIPREVYDTVPRRLNDIASNIANPTRDRIRAMEALSALIQQRMDAALEVDRIKRLDGGSATERVEVLNLRLVLSGQTSRSDVQLSASYGHP